jgi:hypothetical protein
MARRDIAEVSDVDMHLGALTHIEPMAEVETAAARIGTAQFDEISLGQQLLFDPGRERCNRQIGPRRQLPRRGTDDAGDI